MGSSARSERPGPPREPPAIGPGDSGGLSEAALEAGADLGPQADGSGAQDPHGASEAHVPLRLTVTRGRLGIELYESLRLGPVEVSASSGLPSAA